MVILCPMKCRYCPINYKHCVSAAILYVFHHRGHEPKFGCREFSPRLGFQWHRRQYCFGRLCLNILFALNNIHCGVSIPRHLHLAPHLSEPEPEPAASSQQLAASKQPAIPVGWFDPQKTSFFHWSLRKDEMETKRECVCMQILRFIYLRINRRNGGPHKGPEPRWGVGGGGILLQSATPHLYITGELTLFLSFHSCPIKDFVLRMVAWSEKIIVLKCIERFVKTAIERPLSAGARCLPPTHPVGWHLHSPRLL